MKDIDKMRPIKASEHMALLREKSGVEFFLKEQSQFVEVNCPACLSSTNSKIVFYKYGFKHSSCSNCKTLYVSTRPTEAQLFQYYREYEAPNYWTKILTETCHERKTLQHMPRVRALEKIIAKNDSSKGLLVDLGAGEGNFSKAVQEAQIFDVVIASDISDKCIESCRKRGLKTKKATVDEFEDHSINCITVNDLIEHVTSPFDFLTSCFKKLMKNGTIMLCTPNGEGFDFKMLGEKTENISPPEHLQYFNPVSIGNLLEKTGFQITSVTTPGILDVSIIKRQISDKCLNLKKDNHYLDFIFSLDCQEIEESLQEFLSSNNLSSHMLVFAKKP